MGKGSVHVGIKDNQDTGGYAMHGHCPSTPAPVPSSEAASVSLDVSRVLRILSRTKEGTVGLS